MTYDGSVVARRVAARPAVAVTAIAAVALAVALTGCSTQQGAQNLVTPPARSASTAAPTTHPVTPSPTARPTPSPSVIALTPPPPGLPQTRVLPSARTPFFHAEMTDLWTAIVTGKPSVALQSFFPLSAYQQVKAIPDPTADWHDRLVAEYVLDIKAAHNYLGASARQARFVRVIVPYSYAAWIVPGVCYNKVGYWHAPGPRLVYRLYGQLHSIGIASLISWRGRWYVVHLGAVIRTTAGGVVDNPSLGTGTPGPPGGC